MDRDLCNPWDTESFSRQYAMLQEQQAAYQAENADFPPGSPAHGSGQLSEAIQGLNDLRLNRGSKVRQEAGPVRRTFFAIGKEREQALNETDKDFIDAFEQTALATTDAAPRTIRNHALGLTRLSNALTADNRPGIADRINDPELDDLASKLDTGKPNRLSVRGLQFARNWHSGRVKGNKAREQALNKTDKEFIGAFEQTALATTDAAPRTIRNHAIGLTRLSNALTADNRPGIADRINDPELDDLALKLDAGKEHKHSVLGLRSARNTHSGRDIGVHKRTVIKPYDQDRDLIESLADRAPVYNHTERTVESYSYGLGAFSTWLRQNKLPAMNGRLGPDQIDALDADIDRALAEPEKIGEETVKLARRGIRALLNMGLGQVAPERHPGSSWSFHTPNEPWPEWQEALGAFANEQHAQPDSSHSSFFRGLSPWEGYNRPQESGSTFAGLSSLGYGMPYGSREFDPNTPQSVIGPAGEAPCPQESGSTFAGLSSLGYGIPYGSREFDPNTPQSVVGPSHPAGPEIVDVDS
ncbi:hypothetical protein, partial [Cupriavidus sp. UYPR2.512]|uniref:hypothetical protein n=1 Tax=Cupriavidus sp. UYPR2.512 TaxID=1080187 RepID=UPI0018E01278